MQQLQELRKAIENYFPIDEEAWSLLEPTLEITKIKKGSQLVKEGETEDSIYFLVSGITRNFFIRNDKEYTIEFHFQGEFVTGYYSIITGEPSIITVETLTDTEVVLFPFDIIRSNYLENVKAANFGRIIAEVQYTKRLKKEMDLLSLTAEERYSKLLQQRPELVKKISVKHLSSYLGIQPESLSRIRKSYI
ncbi:Crp/Fnr family transcriptional regulator [Flavobacterium sp. RHBU_3]|uniref:Crp/Fnr family transcriptional regulator n=1 Tax=Flavobacterium sp. RHBU_3 TaxID=3391184 RepID=UPI003984B470